jgi:hypothetical protein
MMAQIDAKSCSSQRRIMECSAYTFRTKKK